MKNVIDFNGRKNASGWNFGRPEKPGTYETVLICTNEADGSKIAHIGIRPFLEAEGFCTMDGEDENVVHWLKVAESVDDEQVYAWRELPEYPAPADCKKMNIVRLLCQAEMRGSDD